VSDETGSGVEGQIRIRRRKVLRIQGQELLTAKQGVEEKQADAVEHEYGDRIRAPGHLRARINSGHSIEKSLQPAQRAIQTASLVLINARHVPAERLHGRQQDKQIET